MCKIRGYHIRDNVLFESVYPPNENDIETLWIKIKIKFTVPIILGILYKPPKTPANVALRILSDMMSNITPIENYELYIMGDFNIDTSAQNSPNSQKLRWFCNKNCLDQLISTPTRSTIHTNCTIDLILTNSKRKSHILEQSM